jgi:hypothetical protein
MDTKARIHFSPIRFQASTMNLSPDQMTPIWVLERRIEIAVWPASRMRRNLDLTPAGWRLLQDSWTRCLRDHADSESVLRADWIALVMSEPERAATYLQQMGEERQIAAQETKMMAEHLERKRKTGPLIDYRLMRICTEAHRRGAESQAFLSIGLLLRERSREDVLSPLWASSS